MESTTDPEFVNPGNANDAMVAAGFTADIRTAILDVTRRNRMDRRRHVPYHLRRRVRPAYEV